ncbi:MAG TPA: L,D-transpeptidase family protein [Terriglobales bacterium]|nr:L,D-transpeptidase family protein [Terriglobales bacterium]
MCLLNAGSAHCAEPAPPKIDKIIVLKSERKLLLVSQEAVVKTYRVALGKNPKGPKTQMGDHRTPEGSYVVDSRNPKSQYHRSLHISYPNAQDKDRARKLRKNPGGDIFIHGLPNGQGWIGKAHVLTDWTLGCIAVTNEEIEEIWRLVPNGTPIEIRP